LPTREGFNLPVLSSNGSTEKVGTNLVRRDSSNSKMKTSVKELKEMFERGLAGSTDNNNSSNNVNDKTGNSGSNKPGKTGKKNGGRKIKRRHTVGGTKDFEKFRRVFQQAWNWNREGKGSNLVWDKATAAAVVATMNQCIGNGGYCPSEPNVGNCGSSGDLKIGWMRTSSPELSPKAGPQGGVNWVELMTSQEAALAVAAAAATGGLVNLEDWERFKRNSLPLGPIVSFALQSKV
jgi:hypothetical protein